MYCQKRPTAEAYFKLLLNIFFNSFFFLHGYIEVIVRSFTSVNSYDFKMYFFVCILYVYNVYLSQKCSSEEYNIFCLVKGTKKLCS